VSWLGWSKGEDIDIYFVRLPGCQLRNGISEKRKYEEWITMILGET
jgi:hypothetical protein